MSDNSNSSNIQKAELEISTLSTALNKSEHSKIGITKEATTSPINYKDVIAWLLTQPNTNGTLYLENVAQHYMYALLSAPAKLHLPKDEARDVFSCHTASELNILWNTFKTASNYEQVNAGTSGSFSAGMKCLSRYLDDFSKNTAKQSPQLQKMETTIMTSSLPIPNTYNVTIAENLTRILANHFSNGYRLNSPIEMVRFRSFMRENSEDEFTLSDDELRAYIAICGTIFDGKVYVVTVGTKERIRKLVEDYFSGGACAIFFAEFYAKNETWLFEDNIVSEKMIIEILRELFPVLSFTQTYFGYTSAPIATTIEREILRVWSGDILLTYDQLAERLHYIPIERIKQALGQNGDFIWNSVETFSHISQIEINDEECEAIRTATTRECSTRSYISITDLPFGNIYERNYELSITAVHNAIYRICLADKFDRRGKIVTKKGDVFNTQTIMEDYCLSIDKCTLDDLLNHERELTGEIHRLISMEAGSAILVRTDKDTYIADRYVYFNVELIDEAIKIFVKGDYLPLKAFTTFGAFPDCGQTWNLFLLESYVFRFSKLFRYKAGALNEKNVGVVIKKSSTLVKESQTKYNKEYDRILVDAIAKSGVDLYPDYIIKFLFEEGYIAKKSKLNIDALLVEAKMIREMRD